RRPADLQRRTRASPPATTSRPAAAHPSQPTRDDQPTCSGAPAPAHRAGAPRRLSPGVQVDTQDFPAMKTPEHSPPDDSPPSTPAPPSRRPRRLRRLGTLGVAVALAV